MASYDELLTLARDVAREAAALVAERRRDGVEVADTKTSPTDVVTEADRAAENLIRKRLLEARPGDGFVGEEGAEDTSACCRRPGTGVRPAAAPTRAASGPWSAVSPHDPPARRRDRAA